MKEAAPPPQTHTHKDTRAAELMQTEDRRFLRHRRLIGWSAGADGVPSLI